MDGLRCSPPPRTATINWGLTLEKGANPNIANNGGWTPLYLATDNRNIEYGDYPVRTPDTDHLGFIELLLNKGANVNARICGVKSTPDACLGDTTETRTNFTMQWLLEDGATAFLRAAQSGDVTLMKLLLAHGANPKIYTSHEVTPLAVAAGIGWVQGITFEWSEQENLEAVKMCLDLGIDVNFQDEDGRAALHGAAHKGRPAVIQLLADRGAKLDIRDLGSRDSRVVNTGENLDSARLGSRSGPRRRPIRSAATGSRKASGEIDDRERAPDSGPDHILDLLHQGRRRLSVTSRYPNDRTNSADR